MSTTQQSFRSAFNGFNREDVVHYIEYLNSKHTAEINQLNSELEFLRSKSAPETVKAPENEAIIAEQADEIENLKNEIADLRESNAQLQQEKEDLAEQLEALKAEQVQLFQEKADLSAQLEASRNQQNIYKSRIDEELAAYRRAERTERLATERANQMYRQANGIIADATVKVDEAAAQIGQLSESVMAQLVQLQQAVSGSNSALKDAAAGMFAIRPETEE